MEKNMFGFFLIGIVPVLEVSSQETYELMAYHLPNQSPESVMPHRKNGLKVLRSNGQPDLFLSYKLNTITAASAFLDVKNTAINLNFELVPYVSTSSDIYGLPNGLCLPGLKNKVLQPLKFMISN
jgi:hypothetical protein